MKGVVYTGTIELRPNPNSIHSPEDRELQRKTSMEIYRMLEDLAFLAANVRSVLDQLKKSVETIHELSPLITKLDTLQKALAVSKESTGITGEEQLREKIANLYGSVVFYYGRPTQSQLNRLDGLKYELQTAQTAFNELLQSANRPDIKTISREDFDKMKN